MVNLGFSLYPEQYGLQSSLDYIDLLLKYGANRLFLSLLQLEGDNQTNFDLYQKICEYCKTNGIEVVADISPDFIEANGWTNCLLEKANLFGLRGIRLDESLAVEEIVKLTHNEYNIKIELNSSTEDQLLVDLVDKGAKLDNIMGCHNFYPHKYTGLSKKHLLRMSKLYKKYNIVSSVFISSNTATEGPWPISEGLPTLEELRYLPLELQVDVLKSTNLFDNLIISNQFIQENELIRVADRIKATNVVFKYIPLTSDNIEKAILDYSHRYRGDISDYVIRSTEPRVKFSTSSIPPRKIELPYIERGSITIDNDNYLRYKGELHVVLKSYKANDKVNLAGRIVEDYMILLDYLQPWQEFLLVPYSSIYCFKKEKVSLL